MPVPSFTQQMQALREQFPNLDKKPEDEPVQAPPDSRPESVTGRIAQHLSKSLLDTVITAQDVGLIDLKEKDPIVTGVLRSKKSGKLFGEVAGGKKIELEYLSLDKTGSLHMVKGKDGGMYRFAKPPSVGEEVLDASSRAAGIVFGSLQAPIAATMGAGEAAGIAQQQGKNPVEIMQAALKGSNRSAMRSIFKRGTFGTTFSEVMTQGTGKTAGELISQGIEDPGAVSYTHLRAHET